MLRQKTTIPRGKLVLADRSTITGERFGAPVSCGGEVVFNTRRPHSALANLPPAAFAANAMRREGNQQQKMEPLPAGN